MASGLGDTFQNDLMALIFNSTTIAELASAAGSATNLYFSLHSADIGTGAAKTQADNEITYGGPYARVAKTRDTNASTGFTVANGDATPKTAVGFAPCTSGTATANDFGVGLAATSTGKLLFYGDLDQPINISTGVTPQLTTSTYCSLE